MGLSFATHNDICPPYVADLRTTVVAPGRVHDAQQVFVFVPLPKNPSGKLLKRGLRTRFGAEQNVFH